MDNETNSAQTSSVKLTELQELPWKIRKEKLCKEIEDTINLIGPNIKVDRLAKAYGMTWRFVDKMVQSIFIGKLREPVDFISHKSEMTIKNTLIMLQRIIVDPNSAPKDKMAAMSMQAEYIKLQAELLEKYGRKQTAVDRIDITGSGKTEFEATLQAIAKSKEKKNDN